jgi:hypothetical protein
MLPFLGGMVPALSVTLLLVLFDMQNLLGSLRRGLRIGTRQSTDFTILVPIWGHPKYLANLDFLRQYKPNVVIIINAITAPLMELSSELERNGWRVHRTLMDDRTSPAGMIEASVRLVTTKYTMRFDGDTFAKTDIRAAVATMEDAGKDLCSVVVVPSKRKSLAEKMQGVEYDMAMRARRYRPWLTSGACYIARTSALCQIMANHTRWYYAEDVETGFIAKHFKMKVGHLSLRVYTDVPSSFRQLFRQRRGWRAGHFRLNILNLDHMVHYPVAMLYSIGLIYLALSDKWLNILNRWEIFPVIIMAYVLIMLLVNWEVRSRWMVIFPIYALMQVIVFPVVGVAWFVWTRLQTGRPARFLVGWRREQWADDTA